MTRFGCSSNPHPPRLTLEVRVRPRVGTRARCSQCRRPAPGYDTLPPRRFDFVPLWQIPVVFRYAMRRVDCPRCGVKIEAVPWASGKHRLTDACAWFLAGWAKRLSWQEVADAFPTSWDTVYRAVRDRRRLGTRPPRPHPHRGHRRRRTLPPPRAALPDPRLPDRRPSSGDCCGSAANAGPRRSTTSSTGSAPPAAPPCASSAPTCGRPTSR